MKNTNKHVDLGFIIFTIVRLKTLSGLFSINLNSASLLKKMLIDFKRVLKLTCVDISIDKMLWLLISTYILLLTPEFESFG